MWPEGKKCAVSFTFDLDAESAWIDIDAENVNRPGALSIGKYGPRVAVPLILSLLEKHDLKATFFIPGKVAEDYPQSVETIAAAGHELAAHGYTHASPHKLTKEQEEDQLTRTKEILEGFGAEISGYRSPSWDLSENTLPLLMKHSFRYSSNLMDDIRPYRHTDQDLIELPIQWILDDWVHFGFGPGSWGSKISTNSEVREIWDSEFEGIYQLGGSFILTMHPQVIGRPSRIKMLDDFMSFVKSHEDTWITTCSEIASQAKSKLS
jgi:peptidoglycan/xylan/chitin deacetylase (PgdA/CDA1 family)